LNLITVNQDTLIDGTFAYQDGDHLKPYSAQDNDAGSNWRSHPNLQCKTKHDTDEWNEAVYMSIPHIDAADDDWRGRPLSLLIVHPLNLLLN
jgi:hypothetical protein